MSFQVINGGGSAPEAQAAMYGIEAVQLAHFSHAALILPYQTRIDPMSADIINTAYADALGLVTPETSVPDLADRNDFIVETHRYAAGLLMESEFGNEFRILASVLTRRPVDWTRLTGIKPNRDTAKPPSGPIARDRRVKALTAAADQVLSLTRIQAPIMVEVTHAPTDERRESFVNFILKGVSRAAGTGRHLRSIG